MKGLSVRILGELLNASEFRSILVFFVIGYLYIALLKIKQGGCNVFYI